MVTFYKKGNSSKLKLCLLSCLSVVALALTKLLNHKIPPAISKQLQVTEKHSIKQHYYQPGCLDVTSARTFKCSQAFHAHNCGKEENMTNSSQSYCFWSLKTTFNSLLLQLITMYTMTCTQHTQYYNLDLQFYIQSKWANTKDYGYSLPNKALNCRFRLLFEVQDTVYTTPAKVVICTNMSKHSMSF